MNLSLIIMSILLSANISSPSHNPNLAVALESKVNNTYSAAVKCKPGFKAGKTAMSLVPGAKPKCVNSKSAAAGKKLLTAAAGVCGSCHGLNAAYPPNQMKANLSAQGYDLSPAKILAAFNAHISEMGGVSITNASAKTISAYLQTLK